jgi:hypothetical protein
MQLSRFIFKSLPISRNRPPACLKALPMRRLLILIFLCLLPCVSGAEDRARSTDIPVWWDHTIFNVRTIEEAEALFNSDFPTEDNPPHGPFPPTQPLDTPFQDIKNCLQTLQYPLDPLADDLLPRRYCIALDTIRKAKSAVISYLPPSPWQPSILSILPPLIGPATYYPNEFCWALASAQKGLSLAQNLQYFTNYKYVGQVDTTGTVWRSQANIYEIAPIARGDFNGDGIEDIIVQAITFIPDNLNRHEVAILTRLSPKSLISFIKMDPNLESQIQGIKNHCGDDYLVDVEKEIAKFSSEGTPK